MIPLPSPALKELEKIKSNIDTALLEYMRGFLALESSGVLSFLQKLARPTIPTEGKDLQTLATQAAWSSGFFDCLECLANFKEFFLQDLSKSDSPRMDFGGVEKLSEKGDLIEGEKHAIRTDQSIDYNAIAKRNRDEFDERRRKHAEGAKS